MCFPLSRCVIGLAVIVSCFLMTAQSPLIAADVQDVDLPDKNKCLEYTTKGTSQTRFVRNKCKERIYFVFCILPDPNQDLILFNCEEGEFGGDFVAPLGEQMMAATMKDDVQVAACPAEAHLKLSRERFVKDRFKFRCLKTEVVGAEESAERDRMAARNREAIQQVTRQDVAEAVNQSLYTTKNANLRAGPGVDFPKVGLKRAGTAIQVVGTSRDGKWLRLEDGSWVYEPLTGAEKKEIKQAGSGALEILTTGVWGSPNHGESESAGGHGYWFKYLNNGSGYSMGMVITPEYLAGSDLLLRGNNAHLGDDELLIEVGNRWSWKQVGPNRFTFNQNINNYYTNTYTLTITGRTTGEMCRQESDDAKTNCWPVDNVTFSRNRLRR